VSTQPKHRFTPDEYLELERAADFKSEYLDGEIFAMGGASPRHVLITTNVAGELRSPLRDQPCTVYSTDLRVQVSRDGLYAYPDVVVICGRPVYGDEHQDMATNPQVIVEVLSKSTKNYDRGEKFEQYRKMASFVEYLLIAQDRTHVEHYVRQPDGTWLLSESDDPASAIELASVRCRLAVTEIYAKVDEIGEEPPAPAA
jgi:Uma2 family endonuclease